MNEWREREPDREEERKEMRKWIDRGRKRRGKEMN